MPWPVAVIRSLWRRLRRPRVRELEPAEAYRRWAGDYGGDANALQRLEATARRELLPELEGRRVLDVGCGRGRAGAEALTGGGASCVGADFTLAMLVAAGAGERSDGMARVVARVERLPFAANCFDLVIAALVLGHVAELDAAVAELARVLAPDGALVITDFHPAAAGRGWQRTFRDPATGRTYRVRHHPHGRADYRAAIERAGLKLEATAEPTWQDQPVVLGLLAVDKRRAGPEGRLSEPPIRIPG